MRRPAWTLQRGDQAPDGVVYQVMSNGGTTVDVLVQTPTGLACRQLDRLSAIEVDTARPEQNQRPQEATDA